MAKGHFRREDLRHETAEQKSYLLRSCAHLLVIKKEQADIAFALRETYTKKAKLKGRISVAVVDFRENCRQRLKVLRNPQAA